MGIIVVNRNICYNIHGCSISAQLKLNLQLTNYITIETYLQANGINSTYD